MPAWCINYYAADMKSGVKGSWRFVFDCNAGDLDVIKTFTSMKLNNCY